jgi:hypothetical protein
MVSATSNVFRAINGDVPLPGDPKKAAEAMWKLSRLEKPPLRLALGKDAMQAIREQAEHLKRSVDEYASWSEDVNYDE